jgi:hypothetical protein
MDWLKGRSVSVSSHHGQPKSRKNRRRAGGGGKQTAINQCEAIWQVSSRLLSLRDASLTSLLVCFFYHSKNVFMRKIRFFKDKHTFRTEGVRRNRAWKKKSRYSSGSNKWTCQSQVRRRWNFSYIIIILVTYVLPPRKNYRIFMKTNSTKARVHTRK